jgi:hypothetical protein
VKPKNDAYANVNPTHLFSMGSYPAEIYGMGIEFADFRIIQVARRR